MLEPNSTASFVPWLTTGCYGDFDPVHTRDMILEAFANVAAVALRNADVLGRCPRCPEPGLEDGQAGPS